MSILNPERVVRDINGILLLNKAYGASSNQVLQRVKRLFGAKKAGHTGSLDPLATGMLPVCFGEATKFSQFLLDRSKTYQVTGLLGIKTATGDAEGAVIASTQYFDIAQEQLEQAILQFLGETIQTPSMYSALKYQGKPLYHYARKGIDVPCKNRTIYVHDMVLLTYDGQFFTARITCSKGTYVRNIVEDIGDLLGVGAHVTALHRLSIEGFDKLPMFTLDALEVMSEAARQDVLLSTEYPLMSLPALYLSDTDIVALQQGKEIDISSECMLQDAQLARVYARAGTFIGLVCGLAHHRIRAKRLLRYG